VEVAERFADGLADASELEAAHASTGTFLPSLRAVWRHPAGHNLVRAAAAATQADAVQAACEIVLCGLSADDLGVPVPASPPPADESAQKGMIRGILSRLGQAIRRAVQPAYDSIQIEIMHDIFGALPFRPIKVDASWLAWNGGTVASLAQAIYDDRAFDRLPILADALEDAGCTNQDILNHCRGGTEHVRGCWVVDLLLGKK
jgi:hypothetical protein